MPYIVKYTLQRIGLLILTAFIILTLTFFLIKMLPDGNMGSSDEAKFAFCMDQFNSGYYQYDNIAHDNLGALIFHYTSVDGLEYYFYRNPVILQYFSWVKGIFTQWNWGTSSAITPSASAIYIISTRLRPTIVINIASMILSVPLGFVFGIIAAIYKNKPIDHVINTVVMILISVPSFVTISLLMLWLAYTANVLPSQWPNAGATIGEYAAALVIPTLSLSFGTIAGFTRYTRAELCEVMSSEFLLLARTKGLNKTQCIIRHALRNSMVPIIPMIIGQFISILSGSMVLENLYSIPGIGSLFVDCITYKDYNVLMVDMALYTMIGLFANLLVDLSYGIVDPRIRMGARV